MDGARNSRPIRRADRSAGRRCPSRRPRAFACENRHASPTCVLGRGAACRASRRGRKPGQRILERRDSHAQDTAKPQETAAMFRRLLAAFDGSTHAPRALTEAVDMAQTNSGRLTVMTVVPEPSACALGSGYAPAVDLNDLSRQ